MIISYSDENQFIKDLDWTITFLGKTNGDNILDPDKQAEITVWLHDYDGTDYNLGTTTNTQYLTTRLGINTKFRVEKPSPSKDRFSFWRGRPRRDSSSSSI